MRMSVQESPAWTLGLAKIWLADITASVFGDGLDKTVNTVSIPCLRFLNLVSFSQRPLLLASSHLQGTPHRCSSASLTFPTCGNPFLSHLGKLMLQLFRHDRTCMLGSSLDPVHAQFQVYLALAWPYSIFLFSTLTKSLHIPQCRPHLMMDRNALEWFSVWEQFKLIATCPSQRANAATVSARTERNARFGCKFHSPIKSHRSPITANTWTRAEVALWLLMSVFIFHRRARGATTAKSRTSVPADLARTVASVTQCWTGSCVSAHRSSLDSYVRWGFTVDTRPPQQPQYTAVSKLLDTNFSLFGESEKGHLLNVKLKI